MLRLNIPRGTAKRSLQLRVPSVLKRNNPDQRSYIQLPTSSQQNGGPHRSQHVIILGALSAFGPLSIDMYLPSLPALSHDFGSVAALGQLTLSACLLGLALGQTIAGPISDALGRRRPLLIGLAAYALSSLLCVVAPSVYVLVLLRFIQGLAGAAGIVIARATVRDLYEGIAAAKFFSLLAIVSGIAPIIAPILGGLVLHFTSWRGVFIVLGIIGVILLLAAIGLRETLAIEDRQKGGLSTTLKTFRHLLANRSFVGYALACGLAFAAMFAYISGSPFVIQDIYGLSPQLFSIVFGINALGIMITSQINGWLVGRFSPTRLLDVGLAATAVGGVALLAVVIIGNFGLIGILPSLFVVVASIGLVLPNAITLAMSGASNTAGSASALLGVLQFAIGAATAPLVGAFGVKTALPMAVVIAVLGICALATILLLDRSHKND
jgi:DHA1 family bicyclomycin/chloramphenicol resistance-like MFS transporter